jgi:hypothetical protein
MYRKSALAIMIIGHKDWAGSRLAVADKPDGRTG